MKEGESLPLGSASGFGFSPFRYHHLCAHAIEYVRVLAHVKDVCIILTYYYTGRLFCGQAAMPMYAVSVQIGYSTGCRGVYRSCSGRTVSLRMWAKGYLDLLMLSAACFKCRITKLTQKWAAGSGVISYHNVYCYIS